MVRGRLEKYTNLARPERVKSRSNHREAPFRKRPVFMTDFFSTNAGKFASLAKQHLDGALYLDEGQREKGKIVRLPTLALTGHGLELMLKACICLNGQSSPAKGSDGHDIVKMWSEEVCEPVRGNVFLNASSVAETDRTTGVYPDPIDGHEVLPLIEEYILALGKLHGERGYPLRYPSDDGKLAPNTPLLVKSLWRTADVLVKRPNDFKLSHFRGQFAQ